jgi:DNA topoisomerase-1
MPNTLLIVESPSKCKKIRDYLNKSDLEGPFMVIASVGHVMDLPLKTLGIDVDNNFFPTYEVSPSKVDVVEKMIAAASRADEILLATDNDREGERIGYDVANILKLTTPKRIIFNEITQKALVKACQTPTILNQNVIDAQTCRRILDRLIGYLISPIANRALDVDRYVSAGRVQSVVTRLVYERKKDIDRFTSEHTFVVTGKFTSKKVDSILNAKLNKTYSGIDETKFFLKTIQEREYTIGKINKKEHNSKPPAPYITSTVQQDASSNLSYSVEKTTDLLQKLYQNGRITYIRTDSTVISEEVIPLINKEIEILFGKEYIENRQYTKKVKGSQEAHECIRPTVFSLDPMLINNDEMRKLYIMIFKRTMASQMASMKFDRTVIQIDIDKVKDINFISETDVITFVGYKVIYDTKPGEAGDENGYKKGDIMDYKEILAKQTFKRPPPRYTESSMVKTLEKIGIGRPSTYSSSVITIQKKGYVEKKSTKGEKRDYYTIILTRKDIKQKVKTETIGKEKNKLFVTELGEIITKYLLENFEEIMDYKFTSKIEEDLDSVAEGKANWKDVTKKFYDIFSPKVIEMQKSMKKKDLGTYKNERVWAYNGKYGPCIQMGEGRGKAKYVSLSDTQSIDTVTIEEAIELLQYPKDLGKHKKKSVIMCKGKYGIYIKYGDKNVSTKGIDLDKLNNMTLKEMVPLLEESNSFGLIKELPLGKKIIRVYKGKYGPYMKFNNKNYKLDGLDPEKVSADECREIIFEG